MDGRPRDECPLCGNRGYVELPIEEPGEPRPPLSPRRVRSFIYGCAVGLPDFEQGRNRGRGMVDPRRRNHRQGRR